eukprot:2866325-Rhodomonas_salina.1
MWRLFAQERWSRRATWARLTQLENWLDFQVGSTVDREIKPSFCHCQSDPCCPPGPTLHKTLVASGRSILAEIYNCFNV